MLDNRPAYDVARTAGRRRRSSHGPRAGFTLLEVLLTIAVLGMALVTIIGIHNNSIAEATFAQNSRIAWALSTEKMGEFEATEEDPVEGSDGGDFEEYPGFSWTSEVVLQEMQTNESEEQELEPVEIFRVTVTVVYPTHAEDAKITLATYMLKKADERGE
ncbi:MAG: prepilin-type N-terminal cleavage/methylation domain-containing protein [Planctomycetota bacterium]|nr:prepilin-type N-terminal cleavage/methylation domain-containing protein [Planctomycetota bacterium]